MSDNYQLHKSQVEEFESIQILRNVISFFKRKWKFYLSFALLGLVIGFAFFFTSKPIYTSYMTAYSWSLDDNKAEGLLSDLTMLIEFADYEQLAKKLNIKEATARDIVSIKVKREKPEGEVVYEDNERKFGFTITAKVYNTNILDSLERGFKYYIESTSYVNNRLSAHKTEVSYNISKTFKEIEDLTTLKDNLNGLLASNKSLKGANIFLSDLGKTSTNLLELHEKLIKQKEEISRLEDFIIIKNFTKYKRRSSPRLLYCVLIGTFISIVLGVILGNIKSVFEFVKNS